MITHPIIENVCFLVFYFILFSCLMIFAVTFKWRKWSFPPPNLSETSYLRSVHNLDLRPLTLRTFSIARSCDKFVPSFTEIIPLSKDTSCHAQYMLVLPDNGRMARWLIASTTDSSMAEAKIYCRTIVKW